MKKTLVTLLALVFVLGIAGTALAAPANPFVDVPAKHWAYGAVAQLAKAGIVDGYGDGTFRGDRAMTRYEMAQVTAKAMAKSEKADAQTKALIDKLAVEFAAELNNLGVRVAKLEANQPNLKFTGVVDVRYTAQDNKSPAESAVAAKGQYRLRMDGLAKVDDSTTFGLRLTTLAAASSGNFKYASTSFKSFGAMQSGADDTTNSLTIDRLYVTKAMGDVTVTAGAQMLKIGGTGMIVDSAMYSFDGLGLKFASGKTNFLVQYGRVNYTSNARDVDVQSIEAATKNGKLDWGLGYATLKNNGDSGAAKDLYTLWHGNFKFTFDSNISLGGEYVTNKTNRVSQDKNAWQIYILYGKQALAKEGDANFLIRFADVKRYAIPRYTNLDLLNGGTTMEDATDNMKSLYFQYTYAFSKNFTAYVAWSNIDDKDKAADRGYKYSRVGITAKF